MASTKDAQATGETFSLKREHPALLNSFLPSWLRIRILNADPDPATQINAEPCGSDPDPQPRDRQRTQEVHNELLSGTTSIKDRYTGIQALILHFVLTSILCSAVDPRHLYTDPGIRTNEQTDPDSNLDPALFFSG
jgi:hypothetical protein